MIPLQPSRMEANTTVSCMLSGRVWICPDMASLPSAKSH
ncbi:hypothetical protein LC55x_3681 [Lysobacter capsici]|nr:hypothetical protein LC55x_3681 [Lysobacter capsici]